MSPQRQQFLCNKDASKRKQPVQKIADLPLLHFDRTKQHQQHPRKGMQSSCWKTRKTNQTPHKFQDWNPRCCRHKLLLGCICKYNKKDNLHQWNRIISLLPIAKTKIMNKFLHFFIWLFSMMSFSHPCQKRSNYHHHYVSRNSQYYWRENRKKGFASSRIRQPVSSKDSRKSQEIIESSFHSKLTQSWYFKLCT